MHLQLTKVRSGRSTKRYARIVQSYRRDDGMPAQKVLANLGELSDQQIANFRRPSRRRAVPRAWCCPKHRSGEPRCSLISLVE
jgi:hypothetical protein